MSRKRRRIIAISLTGAAGLAAVLAASSISTAAPAPAPAKETFSYETFSAGASDPDVARRIAAGEDPATIPGVQVRTDQQWGQLAPSSEERERQLAEENYQRGVTYSRDSSELSGH